MSFLNVLQPHLEFPQVPPELGALYRVGYRYLIATSPPLKMPASQMRRAILVAIPNSNNSPAEYAVWWQNLENLTTPVTLCRTYNLLLDPTLGTYHGSYHSTLEDALAEFNMRCDRQLQEYIRCKDRPKDIPEA